MQTSANTETELNSKALAQMVAREIYCICVPPHCHCNVVSETLFELIRHSFIRNVLVSRTWRRHVHLPWNLLETCYQLNCGSQPVLKPLCTYRLQEFPACTHGTTDRMHELRVSEGQLAAVIASIR